jgi:hypothetical protein
MFGIRRKKVTNGLMTPGKYVKIVKRRRRIAQTIGYSAVPLGLLGGLGASTAIVSKRLASDPASVMMAGTLGGWAGIFVGVQAAKKMENLNWKTLAEAHGRPKIAEMLARQFDKRDKAFADELREIGQKGKKLNAEERKKYVEYVRHCVDVWGDG